MKYILFVFLFAARVSMAQTIAPADLEQLQQQFNRANFLKAKGFVQSADSINGTWHQTQYTNFASGSVLQVIDYTDSEGATTFTVHVWLTSETPYKAFLNRLKEEGFTGPKGDAYKKMVGTYVTETVETKGKQLLNGRSVFELIFVMNAGKEVSQPAH